MANMGFKSAAMSGVGAVILIVLLIPSQSIAESDCGWLWQLEPSDTVAEYHEASIPCQTQYVVESAKCDSCLTEEHVDALEIGGVAIVIRPDEDRTEEPYGRVMACFNDGVDQIKNMDNTLESVFKKCVVRETGIPFEE